jgi:hypothetical protein
MTTAQNLIDSLEKSIDNLVTLKIITSVGPTTEAGQAPAAGATPAAPTKALVTTINLLQGDITTEIDPAYLTPEYKPLWDFHSAREKQGADIIKANIEAIEKLFKLISSARS